MKHISILCGVPQLCKNHVFGLNWHTPFLNLKTAENISVKVHITSHSLALLFRVTDVHGLAMLTERALCRVVKRKSVICRLTINSSENDLCSLEASL